MKIKATDKRGLELWIEVMAHIELWPENWNQGVWLRTLVPATEEGSTTPKKQPSVNACGTSHCAAGWATHLTGAQPVWHLAGDEGKKLRFDSSAVVLDGEHLSVQEAAQRALGLSISTYGENHGGDLFGGDNTLEDLYAISAELYSTDEDQLRAQVQVRTDELHAETVARINKWLSQGKKVKKSRRLLDRLNSRERVGV